MTAPKPAKRMDSLEFDLNELIVKDICIRWPEAQAILAEAARARASEARLLKIIEEAEHSIECRATWPSGGECDCFKSEARP